MKRLLQISGLLTVSAFLYMPAGMAQENEASPDRVPENTNVPAGQEVEINEDNYRQFMELKNARLQRGVLPEDAFKPGSGLQKLDKLPEESQKHLRNQLREIIMRGDQWQPGDEGKKYAYVPSEAARTNRPLQKQEAEAWGELVDSYHKREAQIYENSARSQAAMASEDSSGGGSNSGNGTPGDGTGQASSGAPDSQESDAEPRDAAGTYSPGASNNPNATNTAGVSQNAMEYLNQIRNGGSNSGASGSLHGDGGQADLQTQATQQGRSEQSRTADSTRNTSNDPNANGMAGTSQNAMKFLQDGNQQSTTGEGSTDFPASDSGQGDDEGQADSPAGQQSDDEQESVAITLPVNTSGNTTGKTETDSTAGASQNALDYLTGEDTPLSPGQTTPPVPGNPGDTLTIEDLLNAQGVGGPSAQLPPDADTPDKDGDG